MSPAAHADTGLAGEHPLTGQVRDFLADCEFAGKRPPPSARTAATWPSSRRTPTAT
jgi:hypothetical protein